MTRIALLLVAFTACGSAAGPYFDADALWQWRRSEDPRVSPDGQWLVYSESWSDRGPDADFANLWLVSGNGKERRRLTEGPWTDSRARWSADSAYVAYIRAEGGRRAIRIRRIASQAETQPIEIIGNIQEIGWAPDGKSLAFAAELPAGNGPPAWAPPEVAARIRRRVETRSGVFVASLAGREPRLISGDLDCRGEPAWMPDGRSVLTAASDGHIYLLPVAGGAPRKLTEGDARNQAPLPSPDGRRIAWLAEDPQGRSYAVKKLWVMNPDGTRARPLSGSLDRDAVSPQWSSDSRTLYFLADDRGATLLYAARNDGTLRPVTKGGERLRSLSLADNGQAVAVRAGAAEAESVVAFSVYAPESRVTVASPNEKLISALQAAAVEALEYGSEGNTIQAWVVKPPGFDPAKRYPLLVESRDDPLEMCGPAFDPLLQAYAARGYVVLCANPRGTPGYGEAFGNLLRTRNPGDRFDDLSRGVDAVIAKGYIDPQRVMLCGGAVSAWAIGQTGRFRAVVARRPGAFAVAAPWDDPDEYVKRSPLSFAREFRTPTLVLAGDPDPGSELLYAALQARRVESEIIRMPKPDRPGGRILEFETVLAWFGKFGSGTVLGQ